MKHLLQKIKEQQERTGLRIVDNIFDYGSCNVVDTTGKSVFKGDRISCQVYIIKKDTPLTTT